MGKTVRDHLVDTLEELTQDGFKRFKTKLNVFPVKAGYSNIPRGQLEKADVLDVCDKLISFYLEKYAVEVTVEVLTAINERELADRLRKATGTGSGGEGHQPGPSDGATGKEVSGGKGQKPGPSDGATGKEEAHFVDRYRVQLIERTAPVEPILDLLHGDILDEEQYQTIRSGNTNQEKMRKLYLLMPSWNKKCKDRLYEALKAKNKFLIEDLEGN
ncbi:apoptosis-associated speck-like protein containing a CARD isoform X1 [Trachemys scripta elegans]|uniref:apoptosis-associated speck-like protein containing a CARD isoform X1 n=1 Tax=Trachemys scripta elegans TaxID=31138 RepID=UPI0015519A8A|nr:apoptosis-associated speck-like protein containing a CARD isoform X1 [Trachemys scripta elegans]